MMRSVVWAMALAVGALLIPGVAPAAEGRAITIVIVNDRAEYVKAETPHQENCSPHLYMKLEPANIYRYVCTVREPDKPVGLLVRLVLPSGKVACEAYWRDDKLSGPHVNHGVECTIVETGTRHYRFKIR